MLQWAHTATSQVTKFMQQIVLKCRASSNKQIYDKQIYAIFNGKHASVTNKFCFKFTLYLSEMILEQTRVIASDLYFGSQMIVWQSKW